MRGWVNPCGRGRARARLRERERERENAMRESHRARTRSGKSAAELLGLLWRPALKLLWFHRLGEHPANFVPSSLLAAAIEVQPRTRLHGPPARTARRACVRACVYACVPPF